MGHIIEMVRYKIVSLSPRVANEGSNYRFSGSRNSNMHPIPDTPWVNLDFSLDTGHDI